MFHAHVRMCMLMAIAAGPQRHGRLQAAVARFNWRAPSSAHQLSCPCAPLCVQLVSGGVGWAKDNLGGGQR